MKKLTELEHFLKHDEEISLKELTRLFVELAKKSGYEIVVEQTPDYKSYELRKCIFDEEFCGEKK
jgi:hypothetical protein